MNKFLYGNDVLTLTRYKNKNNVKYKLTCCNIQRISGYDVEDVVETVYLDDFGVCVVVDNIENPFQTEKEYKRSLESLSRTKRIIFEYAMCNDWDYFCTFTLSKENGDRFDLSKFSKKFRVFINNYNRKLDNNIKYLLIPEKHKNGAWHMHGLISGLLDSDIKQFQLSDKLPMYLRSKIKQGEFVGSWVSYARKFGFNDIEFVRDHEKVSGYITKYITKDMLNSADYIGQHLYYSSHGLNKAQKVEKFDIIKNFDYGFENDFCKIRWFDSEEELLQFIKIYNENVSIKYF